MDILNAIAALLSTLCMEGQQSVLHALHMGEDGILSIDEVLAAFEVAGGDLAAVKSYLGPTDDELAEAYC